MVVVVVGCFAFPTDAHLVHRNTQQLAMNGESVPHPSIVALEGWECYLPALPVRAPRPPASL